MNDLIEMIANRDGISLEEARQCIDECQEEINYIITSGGTLDEIEDALRYCCGVEPDYLDLFLL